MSQTPYEVVAGAIDAYLAAVGTAFPEVDEVPSGSFVLIGTSGSLNYDESGVSIAHKDKIETFRPLGSTATMKAFRTEEELSIKLKLVDVSLEQYKLAINSNVITTVPGVSGHPGYKSLGLTRGQEVQQYALLLRGEGLSAYGIGAFQYEFPVVFQGGDPNPIFAKGKPAALELQFMAMVDQDATSADERFGRLVQQTSIAT